MAAVPQLERIAALVERLGPLGSKQRGMLIEADDWNELVDVLESLLEIERAQERGTLGALEEGFARKNHKHIGEIGLESLDPELRSRIGEASSVSTRIALGDVESKIGGLGTEVGRLTATVEEQQRLIDRTAVDELERSTKLRGFEDRFEGVEELRGLVGTLTGEVQGLRPGVDAVLELRDSLRDPQGIPIDVAGMRTAVSNLEKLRENLTGVDGKLLRLRDFEVQIKEIQDVIDTRPGRGLDTRFTDLANALETKFDGRIDERGDALRDELKGTVAETRTALSAEVKDAADTSRGELDATLTTRLGEAEGRLDATLTGRVDAARADLRSELSAEAAALVDARVPGVVSGAVATAKAELRASLRNQLSTELGQQVETRVAAAQKALEARAAAQDSKLDQRDQQLPAQIADRVQQVLPDRLEAALADLDSRIGNRVDTALADLDQRLGSAVDAALPERVKGEVAGQIRTLDLDSRVKEASAGLIAQWRSELATASDELKSAFAEDFKGMANSLRGDLDAVRRAAVEEAVAGTDARISELRASVARDLKDVSDRSVENIEVLRRKMGSRVDRLDEQVFGRR